MRLCKMFFCFWLILIAFAPAYAMQKGGKDSQAALRPEPVQPESVEPQELRKIGRQMREVQTAFVSDPCIKKVCEPMIRYCTVKNGVHPAVKNAVLLRTWLNERMTDPHCNPGGMLIGKVLSDFFGDPNKFFNDRAIDHFIGQVKQHSQGMLQELKKNFKVDELLDRHKDLWNDLGEEIGSEDVFQKVSAKDRAEVKVFRSAFVSDRENGIFLTEDESRMSSYTAVFYHLLKRFEKKSDWKILSHSFSDSRGVIGRGANNDFLNFIYDNFKKDVDPSKQLAGPLFRDGVADHLRLRKIMDFTMHASNLFGTAVRLEGKCEQVKEGDGATQVASELLLYIQELQASFLLTDEFFPGCQKPGLGERQVILKAFQKETQALLNIIKACPNL